MGHMPDWPNKETHTSVRQRMYRLRVALIQLYVEVVATLETLYCNACVEWFDYWSPVSQGVDGCMSVADQCLLEVKGIWLTYCGVTRGWAGGPGTNLRIDLDNGTLEVNEVVEFEACHQDIVDMQSMTEGGRTLRLLDADDSICADVVAMTTDDMLAPTLLTMNEATVEMVRIRRGVEVGCPGCGIEAHTLEYAVASVLRSGKSAFLEECAHPWTDLELIKAVVPCEPGLYLALPRCYIPKMVQLHRDMAYTSNAYTTYEKSRPGRIFLDAFGGVIVPAIELEPVGWFPKKLGVSRQFADWTIATVSVLGGTGRGFWYRNVFYTCYHITNGRPLTFSYGGTSYKMHANYSNSVSDIVTYCGQPEIAETKQGDWCYVPDPARGKSQIMMVVETVGDLTGFSCAFLDPVMGFGTGTAFGVPGLSGSPIISADDRLLGVYGRTSMLPFIACFGSDADLSASYRVVTQRPKVERTDCDMGDSELLAALRAKEVLTFYAGTGSGKSTSMVARVLMALSQLNPDFTAVLMVPTKACVNNLVRAYGHSCST